MNKNQVSNTIFKRLLPLPQHFAKGSSTKALKCWT